MNTERHRVPIEVGQVWEVRTPRRDRTRERVKIVALNGREATVESDNPLPPRTHRRKVQILCGEIGGAASVGNMRLVQLADGGKVEWPPSGMRITYEPKAT